MHQDWVPQNFFLRLASLIDFISNINILKLLGGGGEGQFPTALYETLPGIELIVTVMQSQDISGQLAFVQSIPPSNMNDKIGCSLPPND